MKPVFGSPVTASDVERLTSEEQEGGKAFVRLCATLVASAIGEAVGDFAVPNWTERTNVRDEGVDAQYDGPAHLQEVGGLVGPGHNVYQVKWRSVGTRPSRRVIDELRRKVSGALKDLLSRSGSLPDRYVLLVNLDLSPADLRSISQALRNDCLEFDARPLIIWGAAEIAAALNTHPHVRHAYFSEGVFCTLETALEELRAQYATIGWSDFVGYAEHVRMIQDFVASPRGRLLLVTGVAYSGKTRTVIESLKGQGARITWGSIPDLVTEDHFRALDIPSGQAVLVIDNCQADHLVKLERWARSRTHLQTILISRHSHSLPDVALVKLNGLSHEGCDALFRQIGKELPHLTTDWIARLAGNNPGLILYGLAAQRDMRERPVLTSEREKPRQVVGDLLRKALLTNLPQHELDALQVLAVLPQVGVDGDVADEIATIAAVLARDNLKVRQAIANLEEQHLLFRRGRFVEVVPELLAVHLAAETLQASPNLIPTLWLRLNESARNRLLRRILDLSDDAGVAALLDEIFSENGWFRTLADLKAHAGKFRRIAEARPRAALGALHRLLGGLDAPTLGATIEGDLRREVVWSLEALAPRAETFSGAAKLLLQLAEAENESFSNNATGVFLSLFHWHHPEISAPHSERVEFLRRGAKDDLRIRRNLIARAAGRAVATGVTFFSHRSEGISVPERPARLATWGDIRQFHASILEILRGLTKDQDQEVHTTAFHEALDSIREMLHLSILENDLHPLADSCFEVLGELARMEISIQMRAELRSTLDLIDDDISRKVEEATREGRHHNGARVAKERLKQVRVQLRDESFGGRLKRWVGPRAWGDDYGDVEAATRGEIEPSSQQIIQLAKEAAAYADRLTPELLDWLLTNEAEPQHASRFFIALGEQDTAGVWQSPLANRLVAANGPWTFGWYVKGVANRNRARAEEVLDFLSLDNPAHVKGILSATFFLPATPESVQRLLSLVGRRLVSPTEITTGIRYGGWIRPLPTDVFTNLVNGLNDGTIEAASGLIELFANWLYFLKDMTPDLQEKAWLFLEKSVPSEDQHFAHTWDRVATWLAKTEPQRFFDALERLQGNPGGLEAAKVLATLRDHASVWKKLLEMCREDTLLCLLHLDLQQGPSPFWLSWCLEQFVDSDTDAEALVRFALENGEKAALAVAEVLDASKGGFWRAVEKLIAAFPDSERVAAQLESRVGTGVVRDSFVPTWRQRLDRAEALLNHPHPKVIRWARHVVDWLEDDIRREEKEDQERFIWDYRISRRQLEGLLKERDSPDRLWAIRRILRRAPTKDVIELLTPEDIQEGLSTADLPVAERKNWEAYLAHWSHRG